MKIRFFLLILVITIGVRSSLGQGRALLGQYFQNMPAFSPALTGANDYLDIQTGFRKQWAGSPNSPNTIFVSAYSPLRPNVSQASQTSKNAQYYKGGATDKSSVKMGIGGYILRDERAAFQQLEGVLNFAVHVPIHKKTYISLGVSTGVIRNSINIDDISVVDDIDQTFQSFINGASSGSSLNINSGISVYSPTYYLSYSAMELSRTFLSGNDLITKNGTRHHLLGGYRFFLNYKWELMPNTFFRISNNQPLFFEAGIRMRYDKNIWFGSSYRNDGTLVTMLGASFSDRYTFGYAYEYKRSSFDNFNNGSHEVTLGLRFFNDKNDTSTW